MSGPVGTPRAPSVARYARAIEHRARRGIGSGRPGQWVDVISETGSIAGGHAEPECDLYLHAQWLEFAVWRDVLREVILPSRMAELTRAIHAQAQVTLDESFDPSAPALTLVCPEDHGARAQAELAGQRRRDRIASTAILASLRRFDRSGSCLDLTRALRALRELAGASSEPGHGEPCRTYDIVMANGILPEALKSVMALPYRCVLARFARCEFVLRHDLQFDIHRELHWPVPLVGDPRRNCYVHVWSFIGLSGRDEGEFILRGGPWFAPELEDRLAAAVASGKSTTG